MWFPLQRKKYSCAYAQRNYLCKQQSVTLVQEKRMKIALKKPEITSSNVDYFPFINSEIKINKIIES